jgi:hypothetical protein
VLGAISATKPWNDPVHLSSSSKQSSGTPTTKGSPKKSTIKARVEEGKLGKAASIQSAIERGRKLIGPPSKKDYISGGEISFIAPNKVRFRIDLVAELKANLLELIEAKFGGGGLTKAQKAAFPSIKAEGFVIPTGENARASKLKVGFKYSAKLRMDRWQ